MRRGLVAVIASSFLFHAPGGAWACSCRAEPPAKLFARAIAVFTGTVARVQNDGTLAGAEFNVDSVYKGPVAPITFVSTDARAPQLGASARGRPVQGAFGGCGIDFVVNTRYAVFASIEGALLRADVCGGTTSDASFVAKAGGTHPTRTFGDAERVAFGRKVPPDPSNRFGLFLGTALLVVLTGVGWMVLRRSRSGPSIPPV